MKGKRTLKRILAMVMAVVFTVCGITFTPEEEVHAYTWTQVAQGNTTVGDWYFWSEWANNFSYDTTTNGFSLNKTAGGGNTWSWQIGEKISDKTDTNDITTHMRPIYDPFKFKLIYVLFTTQIKIKR